MVIDEGEKLDVNAASDASRPPRWALLVLVTLMMTAYLGLRVVIALAVVIWMAASDQPITPEALASSEMFTWVSLVSGAIGAVATVCVALGWSRIWRWVSSR